MSKSLTIIVQPIDSDAIHQAVLDAANRIAEVVGQADRPWDVDVVEGTFDAPLSGDNIHGLGRKPTVLDEIVGLIGLEVFAQLEEPSDELRKLVSERARSSEDRDRLIELAGDLRDTLTVTVEQRIADWTADHADLPTLTWASQGHTDEPRDQQADLHGPYWASIGPDNRERPDGWSWTVLNFDAENAEVAGGLVDSEDAAKAAVEAWDELKAQGAL